MLDSQCSSRDALAPASLLASGGGVSNRQQTAPNSEQAWSKPGSSAERFGSPVVHAGCLSLLKRQTPRIVHGIPPSPSPSPEQTLRAYQIEQLLADLHSTPHPNAMALLSLQPTFSPHAHPHQPALSALRVGPLHRATVMSVNQAFLVLAGAVSSDTCDACTAYLQQLLSTNEAARAFFRQTVSAALGQQQQQQQQQRTRPPAGADPAAAAAEDASSGCGGGGGSGFPMPISMDLEAAGQPGSPMTLTLLPFTAFLARDTRSSGGGAGATAASAAADALFPALFVELDTHTVQLAVQRSSVCMSANNDPVTMFTMDRSCRILWSNYASQVCTGVFLPASLWPSGCVLLFVPFGPWLSDKGCKNLNLNLLLRPAD